MKWFLKLLIYLTTALNWWLGGSTNCIWMFYSWRYNLIDFNATLSMILKLGLNPLLVMQLMWVWKSLIIVSYLVYFIGSAKIAFVVQLYRMKMEMYTSMLLMGKFPVFSTLIVPSFLFTFAIDYSSSLILLVGGYIVTSQSLLIFLSGYFLSLWYLFFVASCGLYLFLVSYIGDIYPPPLK